MITQMKKQITQMVAGLILGLNIVFSFTLVYAGTLDDSGTSGAASAGSPAAYGYTLTDLYQKIRNGTSATAGNHLLTPSVNTSTATMWSIDGIWTSFNTDATACNATLTSDVSSGKVFFATSGATRGTNWGPVTGTKISPTPRPLPDTGQTTSYTTTFGEDHDYQPAGSQPFYTDNGNGTITDNRTGLMWVKDSGATTYTWEAALTYCEGLTYATYTDWRLPNIRELMSIVDYGKATAPRINTIFVSQSSNYWSSTTYMYYTTTAWYVSFSYGNVSSYDKTNAYYVRPVRLGQ